MMDRVSSRKRVVGVAAVAVVVAFTVLYVVFPSGGQTTKPAPSPLKSGVVCWKDATSHEGRWGEMRTYFRGETTSTTDAFVAVAVVKPGEAVHRAHRHAEEEYLIINEGSGVWQLGDKTFPARKSDILYVEPWVYHGLTNTGDVPLVFTVVKYNGKGVPAPPRPDSGKDEL